MPDGKPDLNGFFQADAGGANYGLETHKQTSSRRPGRGVVVDPPDGKLPYQPWARAEKASRDTPERGYDDPTAHCFVGGVPRSMYVPSPFHILQTAGLRRLPPRADVVAASSRSTARQHLPDTIRLWQGDSVGRWEGDTLVVETKNLNGKTWLNEVGDVISHAATVVERFTPVDADRIDLPGHGDRPDVYTRPWTIEMPLNRQPGELLEVACQEDNQDLQHLKDVRDECRAKQEA